MAGMSFAFWARGAIASVVPEMMRQPLHVPKGMIAIVLLGCTSALAGVAERRTGVVKVVEKVGPAVVNITARATTTYLRPMDPFGMLFRPDQRTSESLGSGVLVDSKGYVVTNYHVIDIVFDQGEMRQAGEVQIVTQDGEEYEAQIIGVERGYDLAVLKISSDKDFPFVPIQYLDEPMIGETVIAVGNPYGLNNTVTTGVVSALHRTVRAPWGDQLTGLLQTDAAINRGNSGGPLLNVDGELIGINASILSESGGSQGIGFAIGARRVQRVYEQYVLGNLSLEARLGLEVVANDARIARQYRTSDTPGCFVWEVVPGHYGEAAQIQRGDVVTHINDRECRTPSQFSRLLAELGDSTREFKMTIVRGDGRKPLKVQIKASPEDAKLSADPLQIKWRGMIIESLTALKAEQLNLPVAEGVYVRGVLRNGRAYRIGIRPDDVIYELNGRKIRNLADFRAAVERLESDDVTVTFRIRRPQLYGGAKLFRGEI